MIQTSKLSYSHSLIIPNLQTHSPIIPTPRLSFSHSPIIPKLQTVILPFFHVHRPEDTLYMEVNAPVIKPVMRLASNGGSHTLNFETVATGTFS